MKYYRMCAIACVSFAALQTLSPVSNCQEMAEFDGYSDQADYIDSGLLEDISYSFNDGDDMSYFPEPEMVEDG